MNIRDEIVARRRARIASEGPALGVAVPERRMVPLVPFGRDPFVITEIKRRSPSKGAIDEEMDPVVRAGRYIEGGALSLSILTEEDYFHGSLDDLMAVKKAHPGAAVLRKDFLLDERDIDISFRAGADAVLLIASILDPSTLQALHRRAAGLGMAVLAEAHSPADVDRLRAVRPALTGINARSLENFQTDLLHPPFIGGLIDWPTRTVFESGIGGEADARLAGSLGFDGILVGEAAVRNPDAVPGLIRGLQSGKGRPARFWREAAVRIAAPRPLVKICGLTNKEDALAADGFGADILGFVLAESPRRADAAFIASLPPVRALRVGVVALGPGAESLPPEVSRLLENGALDAVQLHGSESPRLTEKLGPFCYKAIRPRTREEAAELLRVYRGPRVLVDAFSREELGGTGRRISREILAAAAEAGPLWMAGGISPDNVREIVREWNPELIDLSSGLEEKPGKKDPRRMEKFFKELS